VAYVRTVKTASGATAVQIVHGSRRGARSIEHIGSAHDDLELEALKAAARQRLAGGQAQLDLGLDPSVAAAVAAGSSGPLEIASLHIGGTGVSPVQGCAASSHGVLVTDLVTADGLPPARDATQLPLSPETPVARRGRSRAW
jgi:hypothetical protein